MDRSEGRERSWQIHLMNRRESEKRSNKISNIQQGMSNGEGGKPRSYVFTWKLDIPCWIFDILFNGSTVRAVCRSGVHAMLSPIPHGGCLLLRRRHRGEQPAHDVVRRHTLGV